MTIGRSGTIYTVYGCLSCDSKMPTIFGASNQDDPTLNGCFSCGSDRVYLRGLHGIEEFAKDYHDLVEADND